MGKKQKSDNIQALIMNRMSVTVLIGTLIIGIVGAILNYVSTINLLKQTMTEAVQIAAERVEQELVAYSNLVYEAGCMTQLSDPLVSTSERKSLIEQRALVHGFQRGNLLNENGISLFALSGWTTTVGLSGKSG